MSEDFELDEGGYDSQDETPTEQVEAGYDSADDNEGEGDDTLDDEDLEIPEGVTMDPSSFINISALDAQIRAQRGEVPQSLPAVVVDEIKRTASPGTGQQAPASQLSFLQPPAAVRSPAPQQQQVYRPPGVPQQQTYVPQQQPVGQQQQQPVGQQQQQTYVPQQQQFTGQQTYAQGSGQQQSYVPQQQQFTGQQTYAPGAGQQTYAQGAGQSQFTGQQTYAPGAGQQQFTGQQTYAQGAGQQIFTAPEAKETHRAVMAGSTVRPVDSVPINYQVFGTRVLTGLQNAKVPLQPDALRRGVYTVAGMASLGNVYDRSRAVDAMNNVGRF